MSINVRLSTLAELKVLSIQTLLESAENPEGFITDAAEDPGAFNSNLQLDTLFKTVGIARTIRVDEEYGTQNLYAIGEPTRPRIVPNNMSVTVSCERIQLDKRSLYNFMLTPEYFYSRGMQSTTGALDMFYYTYMFIRSKEDSAGASSYDIYAVMPRTSSKNVTNGDVMISHNVQMTGFKVSSPLQLIDLATGAILDKLVDSSFINNLRSQTGGAAGGGGAGGGDNSGGGSGPVRLTR
jgi:hypothetical protein